MHSDEVGNVDRALTTNCIAELATDSAWTVNQSSSSPFEISQVLAFEE
jgi:hypothetical protein